MARARIDARNVKPLAPLQPVRPGGRHRLTPPSMTRVECTVEQLETVQRLALSIFTDMSNEGYSLRECLAAVYLSGLQHGAVAAREQER